MEKLGVEVEEDNDKTATDRRTCPSCGSDVPPPASCNVPCCPRCGTEPFEKASK